MPSILIKIKENLFTETNDLLARKKGRSILCENGDRTDGIAGGWGGKTTELSIGIDTSSAMDFCDVDMVTFAFSFSSLVFYLRCAVCLSFLFHIFYLNNYPLISVSAQIGPKKHTHTTECQIEEKHTLSLFTIGVLLERMRNEWEDSNKFLVVFFFYSTLIIWYIVHSFRRENLFLYIKHKFCIYNSL